MVGERVERALDRGFVVDSRRRSERRKPGRPLAIVGEQPMHIGPRDEAVCRDRAVELPVGEAKKRPRAVRTFRLADMHLVATERRAIREAGAKLLFLPPYSPDLNPIEQVFAKLKTLLRKAAERTVEATWKRIGMLLNEFKPQECANYLRNSGYASN